MIRKIKEYVLRLTCVLALLGGMTACDGFNINFGPGGNDEDDEICLTRCWHLKSFCGVSVDADIYIHAHTHLPLVFKEAFFRVSGSNSSVALVDKLFVNTAASLNYGGYGDKQGFKPASKSSPIIYLDGLKHNMWAKL